jgi:hypothetical protein
MSGPNPKTKFLPRLLNGIAATASWGQQPYHDFLTKLAQASGIETPTRADLATLDRKRKKKGSNDDWTHPHDPRRCGAGYRSQLLSRRVATVVGVDISQETIDLAASLFEKRIDSRVVSADAIPVEDDSIDAALSIGTIEYVENDEKFIRRAD